ncbi:MAG: 3'(2'),5'-bisphosphate nucleotidase CysQ [Xanthomonadales bacterium]|nr:3'(2'),5'-bisphosphate nucleotidase CysQ [Gammaproteobacteria bacterium]MBT8054273.1 3'(2'),5'-bisphosphate nucleotidase CysQ [Gammaproteobacteria bacterium]NND57534.1 3'(2'),5'-bisphosphate nucleotidase CysQ [Xanthomonadales bacterium]NNK51258.1 3'(2'),5'-bisphosphate nucleotidase CysQ [Xanthomonadales bacterium]
MTESDLGVFAEAIAEIAVEAGKAIIEIYKQDFEVTQKDDESPLTQADLASNRIICDALAHLTPDTPILSEESSDIDWDARADWTQYWLVDPLDGTKEFIDRNGEFTVNIALIRYHSPILGVVHVPVTGTTYTGLVGKWASRHDKGGAMEHIRIRKPCADPVVVVGSRSHANPKLQEFLDRIGDHELVSMGSSLKFCLLAEGKADFYPRLGPTSEWDTAAAHAVVLAAGGKIITLDGKPLRYNLKKSLLNPEFLVIADSSRDWLSLFSDYRSKRQS